MDSLTAHFSPYLTLTPDTVSITAAKHDTVDLHEHSLHVDPNEYAITSATAPQTRLCTGVIGPCVVLLGYHPHAHAAFLLHATIATSTHHLHPLVQKIKELGLPSKGWYCELVGGWKSLVDSATKVEAIRKEASEKGFLVGTRLTFLKDCGRQLTVSLGRTKSVWDNKTMMQISQPKEWDKDTDPEGHCSTSYFVDASDYHTNYHAGIAITATTGQLNLYRLGSDGQCISSCGSDADNETSSKAQVDQLESIVKDRTDLRCATGQPDLKRLALSQFVQKLIQTALASSDFLASSPKVSSTPSLPTPSPKEDAQDARNVTNPEQRTKETSETTL